MPNPSQLGRTAAMLLPYATDADIAAWLLGLADVDYPVQLSTALPSTAYANARKWSVSKATMAARYATDPSMLDKLARDPRLTVRRTAAANEHLSSSAMSYLHAWAHSHDDAEVLYALADRIPLAEVLDALETSKVSSRDLPNGLLASRFAAEATGPTGEALALRALTDGPERLALDLIAYVARNEAGAVTVPVVLNACSDDLRRGRMGFQAARDTQNLELATAQAILDHFLSISQYSGTLVSRIADYGQLETATDQAATLLLTSGHKELFRWAANAPLSEENIDLLLDTRDDVAITRFVSHHASRIDAARVERLVKQLDDDALTVEVALSLLEAAPADLSSATLLALLPAGNITSSVAWLSGETKRHPRPGEIKAFVADPGLGFVLRRSYTNAVAPQYETTAEQISAAIRTMDCTWLSGHPWSDEFSDALGSSFISQCCGFNRAAAAHLTARFQASFAGDGECWSMATQLLAEWEGSVGELTDTVLLACGHELEPTKEEPSEDRIMVVEQLSIL